MQHSGSMQCWGCSAKINIMGQELHLIRCGTCMFSLTLPVAFGSRGPAPSPPYVLLVPFSTRCWGFPIGISTNVRKCYKTDSLQESPPSCLDLAHSMTSIQTVHSTFRHIQPLPSTTAASTLRSTLRCISCERLYLLVAVALIWCLLLYIRSTFSI